MVELLVALLVKHWLTDFCLQNLWMIRDKSKLFGLGGLVHAAIHGVFTFIICYYFIGWPFALFAGLADYVIHYTIDYSKELIQRVMKLTPAYQQYWMLFGFDQLLHMLTYVAIWSYARGLI